MTRPGNQTSGFPGAIALLAFGAVWMIGVPAPGSVGCGSPGRRRALGAT